MSHTGTETWLEHYYGATAWPVSPTLVQEYGLSLTLGQEKGSWLALGQEHGS